jgi:GntP family gluconate:H+ symporter
MLLAAGAWSSNDTRLVVAAVAGIAVIVLLISWLKLHPFLSLAIGSATIGIGAGLPVDKMVSKFTGGIGSTVGDVGLLVALGSMLGKLLTDTGGADRIVDTVLSRTSGRRLPWAMLLVAALLGLPLFMEIGVVLLVPIVMMTASRAKQPLLRIGIPMLAGLSILHGLVPPHPGPLVAVKTLHVDLGLTLALGVTVAIPTAIVAGPVFGTLISKRIPLEPRTDLLGDLRAEPVGQRRPGFGVSVLMLLLPVLLMLGKSAADLALSKSTPLYKALDTLGNPVVALLLTVLLAAIVLGRAARVTRTQLSEVLGGGLPPVAGIILIIGAGGGLKNVLTASGVEHTITDLAHSAHMGPLVLGYLIAVGVRIATGSATVSTITAAGIAAPMVAGLPPVQGALVALAIGAGSLFFSHVNDAGFWMVKEYFGMSVGQTLRSWSVMETILSVFAFALILVINAVA